MSYLKVPVKVDGTLEYRIRGPSDTAPEPVEGYQIDPEPIEISGVPGKFWVEYKVTTP